MWNGCIQILNIFNKQRPPNPTFCIGQLSSHLVTSVSIFSFRLTARHTFSVTRKSRDWDGQIVLKIVFVKFSALWRIQDCAVGVHFSQGHQNAEGVEG